METLEYRFIDKSAWERGPWDEEPDKVQWPDPATGLPCVVRRGPMGTWCGYVGIAPHLKPLIPTDDYGFDLSVHGGITYSAPCDGDEEHGICHRAGPGEPDPVFWIGFDCGHVGDTCPKNIKWERDFDREHGYVSEPRVYRDLAYVRAETTRLAAQIAAALPKRPSSPEETGS